MTDRLTIQIDDAALQQRLNNAIAQLERPRELLDAVGAVLETNVALRIDDFKADPNGAPWAALMPSTQKAYVKKYKGNVPGSLLDRYGLSAGGSGGGGLRAGLTHNMVGDNAVEIGFDVPYAIFHEFGTSKMKRRGLLTGNPTTRQLGEEDRADVEDLVDRFLLDLL